MKIRKLADAAIVAALLLTSLPDASPELTPADLLAPATFSAMAVQEHDTDENPASRELS